MTFMRKVIDFFNMDNWKQANPQQTLNISRNTRLLSEAPSIQRLSDPFAMPTSISDLKEWHYRALRKLNKHPTKEKLTGRITLEVDFDHFPRITQELHLLTITSYEDSLHYIKNIDLQNILKEYHLKSSGNKNELINRILLNLSEEQVVKCPQYSTFYLITPKGKTLIEDSYALFHKENLSFFANCIELIKAEKIDEAYRLICKKYAEMPLPPGIGCDWKERYYKGLDIHTLSRYKIQLSDATNILTTASSIFMDMSGCSLSEVENYISEIYNTNSEIQELHLEQMLEIYEISKTEYERMKNSLSFAASPNDIIWGILNARLIAYKRSRSYPSLRKTYYNMALILHKENDYERALEFYCIVLCFDINGFSGLSKPFLGPITDDIYRLREHFEPITAEIAYSQCLFYKKISEQSFVMLVKDICTDRLSYGDKQQLLNKYI